MKHFRNIFIPAGITSVFLIILVLFFILGSGWNFSFFQDEPNRWIKFWNNFINNQSPGIDQSLVILLAQIVIIIIAVRIFSWIFRKAGQPGVIGEIVAGIVLGPSLFGFYFPESFSFFFPEQSLDNLELVSYLGLVFFLFAIGLEMDLKVLKTKAYDAVVISLGGVIFPFILGMGLAYILYGSFAPAGIRFFSFGLFFGLVLSVTALPVLARIAQERGLHKTGTGTVAVASAAISDILVWSLLAVVLAVVRAGSFAGLVYILVFAGGYIFLMIKVVRPFLKRVAELHPTRENLSKPVIAIFFITLAFSSLVAELAGIHGLFGAFLAGVVMPENTRFRNLIVEKIEDVAVVFLLPLFFVLSGLRTQIGLLDSFALWKVTGLIILVAVAGKFLGSALPARFAGRNWKDSLTIGALMNTRGLMVLVILNIGYDFGVFTPEIFTMMIVMALVTTLITSPSLVFVDWVYKPKSGQLRHQILQHGKYNILVSFANPETGRSLVRIANAMTKELGENASVTVMHLSTNTDFHSFNLEQYEAESFAPVVAESKLLNQKISTLFKVSNDIEADIAEISNRGDYDLLLVGMGKNIFDGSLLGRMLGFTTRIISPDKILNQITGKESLFENTPFNKRTRDIISKCNITVGIFIDKGFKKAELIIMPVLSEKDINLLKFLKKFIKNSGSQVMVADVTGKVKNSPEMKEKIRSLEQIAPNHITISDGSVLTNEIFNNQDLMIISAASWKKAMKAKYNWLIRIPCTLIISDKKNN